VREGKAELEARGEEVSEEHGEKVKREEDEEETVGDVVKVEVCVSEEVPKPLLELNVGVPVEVSRLVSVGEGEGVKIKVVRGVREDEKMTENEAVEEGLSEESKEGTADELRD